MKLERHYFLNPHSGTGYELHLKVEFYVTTIATSSAGPFPGKFAGGANLRATQNFRTCPKCFLSACGGGSDYCVNDTMADQGNFYGRAWCGDGIFF
jgi:hypothetical protein